LKNYVKVVLSLSVVFISMDGCMNQLSNVSNEQVSTNNKELVSSVDKKSNAEKQEVLLQKSDSKKFPDWILNPDFNNNIGAVGSVNKNIVKDRNKQKYMAKKFAISNLQKRKSTMVDSEIETKRGVNKSSSKTLNITTSHFIVDNIMVKDEFEDDNNYYVWVVIRQ